MLVILTRERELRAQRRAAMNPGQRSSNLLQDCYTKIMLEAQQRDNRGVFRDYVAMQHLKTFEQFSATN